MIIYLSGNRALLCSTLLYSLYTGLKNEFNQPHIGFNDDFNILIFPTQNFKFRQQDIHT